jgi:hypothetical protein
MLEWRYFTSVLDGGEWSALPLRKISGYPLNLRLGAPPIRSGQCGENTSGNRTPSVQLVTLRYIDCVLAAPADMTKFLKISLL